ncbi:MAG: aminodeoxychorismate synthase component I [Firmicutes bacterium]|nr:aminodeoxychorismate synthase component I [Bacillota bacterium]
MNDPAQYCRFDFAEDGAPRIFHKPVATWVVHRWEDVAPTLEAIEQARLQGFWVAGWIAYEAAPAFDAALVTHSPGPFPLLWFSSFPAPAQEVLLDTGSYRVGEWVPSIDEQTYTHHLSQVHAAIRAGVTYQVNYTFRLAAPFAGDPRRWYADLLRAQAGRFSAYVETPEWVILSASPELFFRVRGRTVETRPMKGTARRGFFDRDDAERAQALAQSAKDRAENIMIVDLLRNDLGKVAIPGTVRAEPLCQIERYPTVWQMTSTVRAELPSGKTWLDVMRALFPCGSVTGAPKASTMALIRRLEPDPRGIYCGTLGYAAPDGEAVFNVAIRTVTVERLRQRAVFGTGGGVTWDSRVDQEYQEAWTKTAFLATPGEDFQLLETFRCVNRCLALKEYHLERLRHAVEYFGWPWRPDQVETALVKAAAERVGAWILRLRYFADGSAVVEPRALTPLHGPLTWDFAAEPMPPADVWTTFKTTRRSRYDERHPADSAWFDHLLYNAAGEVTEFTRGNLVVRLDGQLWTPALSCGLLPGTFRQWLLDRGVIAERVLTRDAVLRAEQCWFINSVRGWVPVHYRPASAR